jgi:ankyrin repeat protein
MSLIAQQDIRQLRSLPIHTYNLNFLIEDKDIQFDQKISPLLSACYIGKLDVALIILSNEHLDVDQCSYPETYTPLMVASYKGYYEIARILLDRNANVHKSNRLGQKPILFCFSRLEETYYKYENKKICMMLIELLLSKGADINLRIDNKLGYTVLMKLVSCDINDKDKLNSTIEIIKFLIERGADIKLKSLDSKNVYDVLNYNSIFKDEIISVLKTTKQVYFYGNEDLEEVSNSKGNTRSTSLNSGIKVETSQMRMDCCKLCKNNYLINF